MSRRWLMTRALEDAEQSAEIFAYSIAKPGGRLVAYRWNGETILSTSNFVWVGDPTRH